MQKVYLIVVIISALACLVNGQALPFAPANPTAPNPWGNLLNLPNPPILPQTQQNAPQTAPFSGSPQGMPMQNPNMMNLPNNYQMAPNPSFSSMAAGNTPQFQYPMQGQAPLQTNLFQQPQQQQPNYQQNPFPNRMQYPMQQPLQYPMQQQPLQNPMQQQPLQYPMQQPLQYPTMQQQPQNPMQQPQQPYNAPNDYTFTTQQFGPPTGARRPQFPVPSMQGENANLARFTSAPSAPSFPQIDPSVLNSVASTFAPALSRGASQLSSVPSTIIQQSQEQIAQSSAAAGMTTQEGQAIIQAAMQRGASILTPPRPKPTSCEKTDFECQFYSACYGCFANRNQPHCMHCLNLDNCAGDLPCQTQRACAVCTRLPKTETKPAACDILKC